MDGAKATYDKAADALCHCKLDLAKSLFCSAGKLYAASAKSSRSGTDIYNLNAAICFYLGGAYDDAVSIIDTIRLTRLDKELSVLSSELYEEARKRRRGTHWESVVVDLKEMRAKGYHKDIINLLKYNPYCLSAEDFARQMRDSCSALGMKDVANLFDHDLKEILDYD